MKGRFAVVSQLSRPQIFFKALLGLILLVAGLGHLTWARAEFLAQVLDWLPLNGDVVVLASGVVEMLLAALLLLVWDARWRWQVGLVVALFFVAIFPGNISQYVNGMNAFGLDTDRARFVRLFFQPVLVLWALWSTQALQGLQRGTSRDT
ncbi:MAG: hypothetical protein IGS03_09205 [Candidatus Sericytochromatia bacterium]|nr:hypothetical protein [Candidatus Sericytochromatia bacterium]